MAGLPGKARSRIDQKRAVLSEALSDLASRTARTLRDAVRINSLSVFVSLDYHNITLEVKNYIHPLVLRLLISQIIIHRSNSLQMTIIIIITFHSI